MTGDGRGRAGAPVSPWWYFVAVGALGPTLILLGTGAGTARLVGAVALLLIVGWLLLDDHGRRVLRPRRSGSSTGQTWRFTGLIVAVIVITQLIQRAADRGAAPALAAVSFVALTSTSWWFTRRIEADVN